MNDFRTFFLKDPNSPLAKTLEVFARAANPNEDFFTGVELVNRPHILGKVQEYVNRKIKKKLHYAKPTWEGSIVTVDLGQKVFMSEVHGASANKKTGQVNAVHIDLTGLNSVS